MNVTTSNESPLQRFIQKNIFYIGALADLIVLDYFTKFFAELYVGSEKSLIIIKDYIYITVSHNAAIAFSLPVSGKLVAWFTPLLLVAIVLMVKNSCDMSKKLTKIALVLIIAGTVGNFVDRVSKGYVVDFLSPSFFPSFNLADAYLTIGVLILIIGYRWISKTDDAISST